MSIIVDGYNYIGRSRALRLSDPSARDRIISLFGQYCRKTRKSVTLVFDGSYAVDLANRKRKYGRVTVIYTSPTVLADDLIKKIIKDRAPGQRKGLLVVTSDADIAQYAQSHEVAYVSSESFERKVHRALATPFEDDRTSVHLSPEEVQKWLEIFGAEDNEQTDSPTPKMPIYQRRPRTSDPISNTSETLPPQDQPTSNAHSSSQPDSQSVSPRPSAQRKDTRKVQPLDELDRINVHLSDDDVEAWLKIFQENRKDDE
jgi:predicted RNA-binding protein with PIN domain